MKDKAWLLAFLVLGACAKKPLIKEESKAGMPTMEAGVPKQEEPELNIRGKDFVPLKDLVVVYFDLNSADLKDPTKEALSSNAQFLKAHPELEVRVDGHCDERGTTEYNLALGQRRAAIVRDHYINLGIAATRIGTLSYGEEKLVCTQKTEECWVKNRRVETSVRKKMTTRAFAQ